MIYACVRYTRLKARIAPADVQSGWYITLHDSNSAGGAFPLPNYAADVNGGKPFYNINKPTDGLPVRAWARRVARSYGCAIIVYPKPMQVGDLA